MKSANKMQWLVVMAMCFAVQAHAETVLEYLTDSDGKYAGPTVEEKIVLMDKDKNGFADASEVRAYLETLHGVGYESEVLDRFAAAVGGNSCGSPFSKNFFVSN